jgi:hypothetical protein
MNRRIIFIAFVVMIFFSFTLYAQEILVPLQYNSVIKKYLNTHELPDAGRAITCDTVSLPFVDDFSRDGIYPFDCLWTDSAVFINDDFADNPPTFGVATFDGVNKEGNPYNPSITSYGIADTLTSKPIDLNFPGDTTIWLSFFYQPQGFGYSPAGKDSLVLELWGSDSAWHRVWRKPGSANTPFKQQMVHVDSSIYLFSGFRFRFMNYASLCGMLDQWNVDYVRLNRNRSAADTVITNDAAFVKRGLSVLNNYQSIPYNHYKVNPGANMAATKDITIRNLDTAATTFQHHMEFRREDLSLDYATPVNNIPLAGGEESTSSNSIASNFNFPSWPGNSLVYNVWNINQAPDSNTANDTLREVQEMFNYYAYDDGTAENGYGISAALGRIAYRFNLLVEDTIVGVEINFVHIDEDVSLQLFHIMVWDAALTDTIAILYNQHPQYTDSINGFYFYQFDSPKIIPAGNFYIGWFQYNNTLLRVGFDRNINSNSNMFYNVTGSWQNSSIPGSWMMRPVFRQEARNPANSVSEAVTTSSDVFVFPNPASDVITVNHNLKTVQKLFYMLYDVSGRIISRGEVSGKQINTSQIKSGLYQLILTDEKMIPVAARRILISR